MFHTLHSKYSAVGWRTSAVSFSHRCSNNTGWSCRCARHQGVRRRGAKVPLFPSVGTTWYE